jgi:hypothetical protein
VTSFYEISNKSNFTFTEDFRIDFVKIHNENQLRNTVFNSNSCKNIPFTNDLTCDNSPSHNFYFQPNPTHSIAILKAESEEAYDFILFDSSGKVIETKQNQKGDLQIDITHQPAGIYFINIKSNNELTNLKLAKIN